MRRAALPAFLAAALAGCGSEAPPRGETVTRHFAPAAEASASRPARPQGRHLVARLESPAWLRAAPAGERLHRLRTRTEFGSPQVLAVTRRDGRWLEVISSHLPNRRRGWIPARAAALGATDISLHVDRSARRLELRRGDRLLRTVTIAVGRPGNETPLGRFAVTDELSPEDPASPYGCCAIALSGHQTKLEPGWPGGDRLAIHGTPATWSIGRAVSLGCMRAHERDLRAIMHRVPLGAPVFVRA